jgi:hypothetical protein
VQLPPERILDPFRTYNMTGRPAADPHSELTDGFMAEHVVEGRHASDTGGCDGRSIDNAEQTFGRQVTVVILDRLQQRDHAIGAAPDSVDGGGDKC